MLNLPNSNTIIGYVRVSTELESQDSSQIRQSATLKKLGAETIVVERESGRNSDRHFYQEILRLIRLGKVKKIIATRSDHISRDQSELRYFFLSSLYGTGGRLGFCRAARVE